MGRSEVPSTGSWLTTTSCQHLALNVITVERSCLIWQATVYASQPASRVSPKVHPVHHYNKQAISDLLDSPIAAIAGFIGPALTQLTGSTMHQPYHYTK